MPLSKSVINLLPKIDKLSKLGQEGFDGYSVLVDELVSNGKYAVLDRALLTKYKIDINKYNNVDEIKKKTFPIIRFYTNSILQDYIKKLYDTNGVYQVGINIYSTSNNTWLGIFKEISPNKDNSQYFISPVNKLNISLEVTKINVPFDSTLNTILLLNDDNMILFQKYVNGIKYILDIDYVDISYVEEGYVT